MAENRYIKGLFKDTAHIDQPKGSWRYAKNMVMNQKMGSITNEGGTSLAGHLGTSANTGAIFDKVLGAIEVNDDKAILFILNVNPAAANPRSEIGVWENGTYTIIFNPVIAGFPNKDLNFNENFPISGVFKVDSKGDLVIYFTDDLNPPRAFNIDRQQRLSTGVTQLYGVSGYNHINLINLFPYAGSVPNITLIDNSTAAGGSPGHQLSVGTGGGLRTGAYYLALAYVDDDYLATNFLTVSNPIPIVDEYDTTRPTTKKDGIKAGSQTSKSITWRINNINTDYKFLRPVVIRKMGDAAEAFRLNDVEVTVTNAVNTQDLIFTGIEGFSAGSLEAVIIDTVAYDTAKTITQLDNILYVGNTTGTKDVGYQPYANNIKLNSIIRTFPEFDEYWATMDNLNNGFSNSPVDEGNYVDDTQSYRFIPNTFKYKGYMRDEIYAFYIAFILNDGSMSYAYHIPGRTELTSISYNKYSELSGNSNETSLIPGTLRAFYDEQASMYQFYDQSILVNGSNIASTGASRQMQFWQNMTELYPTGQNFDVRDRNGFVTNLQGLPVRHHHFPSNENQDRCSIVDSIDSEVFDSVSTWTPASTSHFTGTYNVFTSGGAFWLNDGWATTLANVGRVNLVTPTNVVPTGTNTTVPHDGTHNNHCFVASSADTQVEVGCHYKYYNDSSYCDQDWKARVRRWDSVSGVTSTVTRTGGSAVCANSWFAGNDLCGDLGNSGGNDDRVGYSGGYAWTATGLGPGDTIWMEGWGAQRGASGWSTCVNGGSTPRRIIMGNAAWLGATCAYSSAGSWAMFRIQIIPPSGSDYRDVDVKHEVRPLGFELEDIHIPQSIADKVQGFRIYRAKRSYSNRTILGQDVGKPMKKLRGIIGLCLEAAGGASALQNLKPLIDKEEDLYHNSAFSKDSSVYNLPTDTDQNGNGFGYINMSFHDFNMLRNHSSLAPATHTKVEYVIGDYTWNGPDLRQDRKMLTEIDALTTQANGLFTVNERWGWDSTTGTSLNCYPPYINSVLFIGGHYLNTSDSGTTGHSFFTNSYELNRPLGQKAKSYVMGDTIFDGNALGLGKIINLLGESHIAFGYRNDWELPALISTQDLDGSGNVLGDVYNLWGIYNDDVDMILVTDNTQITSDSTARHKSYMLNLKAYKTDLYKSIDSNELIWTGFQVLGPDLDNFVFDEMSGALGGTGHTIDVAPEGIWGGDTFLCRYGVAKGLRPLDDQTESTPEKGIYYHIVESPDNINFRHQDSQQHGYFPMTPATHLMRYVGKEDHDYTHRDKIGYNDNYSLDNDVRTAFPLPLRVTDQDDFPTRTHRSAKNDTTSLIDNYRTFLANQFKDLPKNRGNLEKLASFNNLLYFHMSESLFAAKGKQSMQMNDGSEAFVGSGDIFTQDPDEMIQTEGGFAGTQSMYAAITTRFGYFFVDQSSRKIFLMTDNATEISNLGMWHWFRDNLPYELEAFGMPGNAFDNPIFGIGYHSIWDPQYKRIILTKREYLPTPLFIGFYGVVGFLGIRWNKNKGYYEQASLFGGYNKLEFTDTNYFTKGGWTVSYYPELQAWGSFHDYIPYIYFNTSKNFYSLTDEYARPAWTAATPIATHVGTTYGNAGIWEHNNHNLGGTFYQENEAGQYTDADWQGILRRGLFEFEYIHNELKADTLLHSSFDYTLETFNLNRISVLEHGFTSFIIYNTLQIDTGILEYLVNIRKIGNEWKVNKFRDMAAIAVSTNPYYMSTLPNVTGQLNTGTVTNVPGNNMFTVSGMDEVVNNAFIDLSKNWTLQKKFIDKWVGIRLIYDNVSNNLLNLYSTNVAVRKMHR